jgi:hypothetical protein
MRLTKSPHACSGLAEASPLPALERRTPLETDTSPALELSVVQRLAFTATGQDQLPTRDQLMINMSRRPCVPGPPDDSSRLGDDVIATLAGWLATGIADDASIVEDHQIRRDAA